jgi:hypothetical protein
MAGPRRQRGLAGPLDAGPLEPLIGSFRLHLAAEAKAARTVQGYTGAVRWFAAAWLLGQAGKTSWEQVDARDIQQWTVHLLDRYSSAYASIQFRALRQFFKWRASEEDSPDPMTGSARAATPRSSRYSPPRASGSQSWRGSAATPAPLPQRPGPARPGDPDPRQGRDGRARQDRPPGGPQPGPVPARPLPAPAGLAPQL